MSRNTRNRNLSNNRFGSLSDLGAAFGSDRRNTENEAQERAARLQKEKESQEAEEREYYSRLEAERIEKEKAAEAAMAYAMSQIIDINGMKFMPYFDGMNLPKDTVFLDKERTMLIILDKSLLLRDTLESDVEKAFPELNHRAWFMSDVNEILSQWWEELGGYNAVRTAAIHAVCGGDLAFIETEVFVPRVGGKQQKWVDGDSLGWLVTEGEYEMQKTAISCTAFGVALLDTSFPIDCCVTYYATKHYDTIRKTIF